MKKLFTLIIAASLALTIQAQDITSTLGTNGDFVITSTAGDGGLLITQVDIADLSSATPVTSPTTGLMVYNTNTTTGPGFFYWDGTAWVGVGSATSVKEINDLTDAKTAGPAVKSYYFGEFAGYTDATGGGNIGIGKSALAGIDNVQYNTGIGYNSLSILSSGNHNTAFGGLSGQSISTGSDNIVIGYGAGTSSGTADNELNIGDAIYATGLYGTSAKVGIGNGNNAPGATLDVKGRIWQTGTGKSVIIGEEAGASANLTTDLHNVYIGNQAGKANVSGPYNTAIGDQALKVSTSSVGNNTAIGAWTLNANTSGQYNTATGSEALLSNTTGSWNAATGMYALHYNIVGIYNTGMGVRALENNTGNKNVGCGSSALILNVGGHNNTAIGYDAGVSTGELTNATAIGYGARVATSNSLVLGSTGSDKVNVGIGTDSPSATLDVVGAVKISDVLKLTPQSAAPTSPAEGDIYYDSDDKKVKVWNGSAWENLN